MSQARVTDFFSQRKKGSENPAKQHGSVVVGKGCSGVRAAPRTTTTRSKSKEATSNTLTSVCSSPVHEEFLRVIDEAAGGDGYAAAATGHHAPAELSASPRTPKRTARDAEFDLGAAVFSSATAEHSTAKKRREREVKGHTAERPTRKTARKKLVLPQDSQQAPAQPLVPDAARPLVPDAAWPLVPDVARPLVPSPTMAEKEIKEQLNQRSHATDKPTREQASKVDIAALKSRLQKIKKQAEKLPSASLVLPSSSSSSVSPAPGDATSPVPGAVSLKATVARAPAPGDATSPVPNAVSLKATVARAPAPGDATSPVPGAVSLKATVARAKELAAKTQTRKEKRETKREENNESTTQSQDGFLPVQQIPMSSRLRCGRVGEMLGPRLRNQFGPRLRNQFGPRLRNQFGPRLRNQFGPRLRNQFGPRLRNQFGPRLRNQFGPRLRNQFGPRLRNQFGPRLRNPFGPRLRNQFGPRLRNQFGPRLRNPFGPRLRNPFGPRLRNQFGPRLRNQFGPRLRNPFGPRLRNQFGPRLRNQFGPRLRNPFGPRLRNQFALNADLPAYQRYHTLAQAAPPGLTLPYHYKLLAEMFRSMDTIVGILYNRCETATFTKVKHGVQDMMRKRFEESHMGQIKTVFPDAYIFRQEKNIPTFSSNVKKGSYQLTVEPADHHDPKETRPVLSASRLLERRQVFHQNLVSIVKQHHKAFLSSLVPPVSVPEDKLTRWHPRFNVDTVPAVSVDPLPQPPHTHKLTTAQEVLDKARSIMTPKMENALASMALRAADQVVESKETDPPSPQTSTATTPSTCSTSATQTTTALKGVSQSLLDRIRAKEAQKLQAAMTRNPVQEERLLMMSRLGELARILRNVFVSEKRPALIMESVCIRMVASYRSALSTAEMEKHLRLLAELASDWLTIHPIRKDFYLKLNKSTELSVVLDKLKARIREEERL
ncbi:uncharacterized protein cdt1 [Diretmus argenteus]